MLWTFDVGRTQRTVRPFRSLAASATVTGGHLGLFFSPLQVNSFSGVFPHPGEVVRVHYNYPLGAVTHPSTTNEECSKSNSFISTLAIHVKDLGVNRCKWICPPSNLNDCAWDSVNVANIIFSACTERATDSGNTELLSEHLLDFKLASISLSFSTVSQRTLL
jgi:hypothetical protein